MSDTSTVGLGILLAACILGFFGDALLRAVPWGINLLLWIVMLVMAVAVLIRQSDVSLTGGGRWLAIPILIIAGTVAWHDSLTLTAVSVLAVLIALGLAAGSTTSGRIRVAGLIDYGIDLILACIYAGVGMFQLIFSDIEWGTLNNTRRSQHTVAMVRGLALAVPLLIVFGGLFMAADAVFENMVLDLIDWDIETIISHLFLFGFIGWIVAGTLRQTILVEGNDAVELKAPSALSLGRIEVGIILGTLNILFLAFVLIQFRYFFGGATVVEGTTTLTYSEYARRGFFELVTVAALVLPMLLLGHWWLRDEPASRRLFRILAIVLIGLLYVIMVSAVQRMRLYVHEFGLTELRLYTTAFMGWLAVVFVWFMATVLRRQREYFAFGALALGFVAIGILHLITPDALIARTNVARIDSAPRPFDAAYMTQLSADSVPVLVESLPAMKEDDRCIIAADLLEEWSGDDSDWRSWNYSRWRARQLVSANSDYLEDIACPSRTS